MVLPPGAQLLRLRPPLLSHPDTSHPASPSAGSSLPTSVVERTSSTAWLNLSSARRSWIVNWLFPSPFLHTCGRLRRAI